MPIHPAVNEILKITNESNNLPVSRISLKELRNRNRQLNKLMEEPEPLPKIMNHIIPIDKGNIMMRIYYPSETKFLPVLLYFHPGSFVKGDINSHDPVCKSLTHATGCIVISINYPLAPENPFPEAIEQLKEVFHWITSHCKELHCDGRIAIGGEDSGGNLAAVLTQELRNESYSNISFQILIYPQLDLTCSSLSHKEFEKGFLLEKNAIEWYIKQYLGESGNPKDPRASPLLNEDLSLLPPGLIFTAEYDPLRDEGEQYAQNLNNAGVPTRLVRYPGMVHGFFQMNGILDDAREAINQVGQTLREHFSI